MNLEFRLYDACDQLKLNFNSRSPSFDRCLICLEKIKTLKYIFCNERIVNVLSVWFPVHSGAMPGDGVRRRPRSVPRPDGAV